MWEFDKCMCFWCFCFWTFCYKCWDRLGTGAKIARWQLQHKYVLQLFKIKVTILIPSCVLNFIHFLVTHWSNIKLKQVWLKQWYLVCTVARFLFSVIVCGVNGSCFWWYLASKNNCRMWIYFARIMKKSAVVFLANAFARLIHKSFCYFNLIMFLSNHSLS